VLPLAALRFTTVTVPGWGGGGRRQVHHTGRLAGRCTTEGGEGGWGGGVGGRGRAISGYPAPAVASQGRP